MLGFYNYTVWMTYASLASGIIGIFFAFRDKPLISVICLGISGILDLFDGKVARTKKNRSLDERKYGIQIDSLSDLVCFAVLPACIGIGLGMRAWYFVFIFVFFILAGMIRLAYFNVLEEHRQEDGGKPCFLGVPITTSAIIVPAFFILSYLISDAIQYVYAGVLFVLGIFYLVKIRIPKPGLKASIIFSSIVLILEITGLVLVLTLCK